ncbi:ubiquinol oxidase, partial [Phenoliferia sp. Uapishka_3]
MPIIEKIDPYGAYIPWKLYRESTRYKNKQLIKDLSYLGRPLERTIILDADPSHFQLQPSNGIAMTRWTGSKNDPVAKELVGLIPFLEALAIKRVPDVRPVIKYYEGKNIPLAYAEAEAEVKRKTVEEWEKRKEGSEGFVRGLLSSALGSLVKPPNRDTPPDTEMEAKRKIYQRMYLEEQKYWKDNEEIIKKQMDEDRERQLKDRAWFRAIFFLGTSPFSIASIKGQLMFKRLLVRSPPSRLASQRGLSATYTRVLSNRRFLSVTPQLFAKNTDTENSKRSFQLHPADSDNKPTPVNSRPWSDWVVNHPVYKSTELDAVKVVRHERKTISDKVASSLVSTSRKMFDLVTRYKHASPEEARKVMEKEGLTELPLAELRRRGFVMDVPQWMMRILFLETIAGVPGMVAGMCRHLQSLRVMRRDGGWIHTLLEEAENERMHLLTFMKIAKPSWFFRLLIVGAQGVYCNLFFLEAVLTYTQIIDEMERGNLPEWEKGAQQVPQIAKDYWRLGDDATMLELVKAVRADEAGHRFVNHTLANLDTKHDFNPFGLRHPDSQMQGTLPGISRDESLKWIKEVEDEFRRGQPPSIPPPDLMEEKAQEVEKRREGEMA